MSTVDTKKLAVLIDADNTSAELIEPILEEIAKYGIASVKRIYGNWKGTKLNPWDKVLLPYALTPVHIIDYTKGKNASDIGLVIDAMDLLYSGTFQGFCIISSDSDFTQLAIRIREQGLLVYGFGKQLTPESFRKSCDIFTYTENLLLEAEEELEDNPAKPSAKPRDKRKTAKQLVGDGTLVKSIKAAIKEYANDEGYAALGSVGQYIRTVKSDFDPRNYGYTHLSKLIKEMTDLFELSLLDGHYKVRIHKKK